MVKSNFEDILKQLDSEAYYDSPTYSEGDLEHIRTMALVSIAVSMEKLANPTADDTFPHADRPPR